MKIKLPLIPLRDVVLLPYEKKNLPLGRLCSIKAAEYGIENESGIVFITQKDPEKEIPTKKDLHDYGTLGEVSQTFKMPDGTIKVIAAGKKLVKIHSVSQEEDLFFCECEIIEQQISKESEFIIKTIKEEILKFKETDNISLNQLDELQFLDGEKFFYNIIHTFFVTNDKKMEYASFENLEEGLKKILEHIMVENDKAETTENIKKKINDQIKDNHRKFFLNEQLKAIRNELEEEDSDVKEYKEKLKTTSLTDEARKIAENEIKRLQITPQLSSEASIIRNYLDWIFNFPWGKYAEINRDISEAQKTLDKYHYGLVKVKERILECLALNNRNPDSPPRIFLIVGPPGVGKTSICKVIAEATNRPFYLISGAGLSDSFELTGHRRTYIGSFPSLFVMGLCKTGKMNCLIQIDEVDKMTGSEHFRNPTSVLLQVLDFSQNTFFRDHYLDFGIDLSKVQFVLTANTLDNLPSPLIDRCEIIRLEGYSPEEKEKIANDFIIKKAFEEAKLTSDHIEISQKIIKKIIYNYTREAGVRDLERKVKKICEKVALKIEKGEKKKQVINEKNLSEFLGKERWEFFERIEGKIGVVNGLSWSLSGGDVLFIETIVYEGKDKIIITGNLREVMKESIRTAYSFIRSISEKYGIKGDFFENNTIHVHVPEGATPKDGPSAGIAIFTSILSAITKIKIEGNIAMTGEITLIGDVLPVGGLKEKLLAARNNGVKKVYMSEKNKKDVDEIEKEVYDGLEIIYIKTVSQIENELFKKQNKEEKNTKIKKSKTK